MIFLAELRATGAGMVSAALVLVASDDITVECF